MSGPGDIAARVATPADAADVARLLHDFNTEYEDYTPPVAELEPNVRELLAAGEITVLLAGEGPEGLAQLRFRRSAWNLKLDTYLEELYVVPGRRGQGIGRALLDEAMSLARSRGSAHIDLCTSVDDAAAVALYESSGFTNHEGGHDGPSMLYYERDL